MRGAQEGEEGGMASAGDPGEGPPLPEIVELNVGGQVYVTRRSTLLSVPGSLLAEMFGRPAGAPPLARDSKRRVFLDRDGFLFRYVLDYLRDRRLALPDRFPERSRLRREAEYFQLPDLARLLAPQISRESSFGDSEEQPSPAEEEEEEIPEGSGGCGTAGEQDVHRSGYLTISYRSSYTLGRESHADGKFRRVARITVCGKTSLAKEVFGEGLNQSRDPDRAPEHYTSRYYLKFTFLEQAFDQLARAGFRMVGCHSAGSGAHEQTADRIWTSCSKYVFYRPSACGEDFPPPNVPGDVSGEDPAGSDPEKTFRKVLAAAAASEPFPDLKTEGAAAGPAEDGVPGKSMGTPRPDPLHSLEAPPDLGPPSEAGSPGSLPWPEAPEEPSPPPTPPSRPTTLDFLQPPKKEAEPGRENGPEGGGSRAVLQSELGKCIEDFRKIKVPLAFPDKKRQWQNQLLEKYQL